ncbi:MAG TPA: O-antigen ligase family protein, partial [Bryocella sp.]|nr:O-antigen ligase family protein [Bryocella sp.]
MARMLDAVLAAGLCLLLAFGPLALGATEASAIFILEEGAVLLLLLWAVRSLAAGRLEVAASPLFIPMLAFAGIIGLQLLLHISAYEYDTWQRTLLWLAYGIFAFLAAQSFRSGGWRKRFGIAFSVFGCLLALFAIVQKFAGNGKIYWVVKNQAAADFFGPYANHSHYAGLMEMLVPFPLVLAMGRFTAVPARVWYGCTALIMGSSIFLSRSRGGVIALVIELGVLTVLASQGRPRRSQIGLWSGFGLLLLFCILLVRPHGLWDRFLQVGMPADKAHDENRLTMLEDSFSMVRARPLLGWGFGNFAVVYPSFRSFYTDFTVNAAHDDVMELTVETGLAGLAVVIAFLYLLYRRGIRNSKPWRHDPGANIALAALVGCTGLVVHSFFDFNLQVPANTALFFVLAVMATATVSEPVTARPARRTFAVAACVVLAVVYGWLAARAFQAARLGSSLDIASLERSIALAPGDAAHQNLLCRFLLFDKQDPKAALPSCQRATELNPYQSGYWLDLALAYYSTGAERQQEQAIRKAVAVDPKTPDVAWNAGNFFLAQG